MLKVRLLLALVVLSTCCPSLSAGDPVLPKGPVLPQGSAVPKGFASNGAASQPVVRELIARDLASPGMAMLVEVNRPIQLIDNPLGRDIWELVRQSTGMQMALASPEVGRFRQVGKFIEKSLSVDWHTGLARLTEGGILFVVQPTKAPAEPAVTVVVTAADEQTLKQFIDAVQVEIRRSANAATATAGDIAAKANANTKEQSQKAPDLDTSSYRTFTLHRVGNGFFSIVGRQLIASNMRDQLESTLDRLIDPAAMPAFELPASLRLIDADGKAPAVLATANLKLIRDDPNAKAGLALPANDPLSPFVVGGYLDLFRRADFTSAGLFANDSAYELKIRFSVGSEGANPGLSGFFARGLVAPGTAEEAPPLLRPTATIFTAGWFRDYQKLWNARHELVSFEHVKELDAVNERGRAEGLRIGIADLAEWIGPHFRVVAARQRETVYKRTLDERLPAVALVIGLRDENAVRDRILNPGEGLLLLALGKLLDDYRKIDYRGAKLTTFRFAENADAADPGKAILFNFNPAYTIARGQLILGSTAEIVRDVIDDLERQSHAGSTVEPPVERSVERTTDRQELSLTEFSELLQGYQNRFVQSMEHGQGQSPAAAAKEIEIVHNVLRRLGSLTTSSVVAPDHFDIRVRLGKE
jgi:hypothetical protein